MSPRRKVAQWSKLDNAAKIFPPTSNQRDTKVFRFACELNEPVDPNVLQLALDETVDDFPFYRSVLKKGLFWYYFESSDLQPLVELETRPPCGPLYDKNVKRLLFQVSYYRRRINLEIYHALSDGTGALQFLRCLVYHYLLRKHADELPNPPPTLDYDASYSQKRDDSFQRYYNKDAKRSDKRAPTAYHLHGERLEGYRIRIVEGVTSAKAVLEKAHELNTTLTGFLAAVLICAIREEMSLREQRRFPVVVTVPVNLRSYYPSESARNFFGVINVGCRVDKDYGLESVAAAVSEGFRRELTRERLEQRMNSLASLEHNILARVVPLAVKDVSLYIANLASEREITTAISNIGRIQMPEELRQYIRLFDVAVSTKRLQLCVCSFGDTLVISSTAPFVSTDIQRRFFRTLTGMGIPVEIISTLSDDD